MAGFQQAIIIGNLTADPELRYSQGGVAVCDFGVAVNKTWNDRESGEKHESVTYFRVSAWRALAETCSQYLRKGKQVQVLGEVKASAYLGQDGQARASLEITARDVQFLGSRSDANAPEGDAAERPF